MNPPQLHSDNPYGDYMQGRHPDVITDTKLFLPEHNTIEYHNPAASSSSTSSHIQGLANNNDPLEAATSQASPFSRHLGRNRACASCRDRKLKCDGQRPICGQCSRAWATKKRSLKAKGVDEHDLRELEQPCLYLDVNQRSNKGKVAKATARGGKTNSKAAASSFTHMSEIEREKMRLEQEVSELRARLHIQNNGHHNSSGLTNEMAQSHPNSDELSIAEILATTMRSGEGFPITDSHPPLDANHLHSFVGSLTGDDRALHIDRLSSNADIDSSKAYSHPIPQLDFHQQESKVPIDPLLLRHAATAGSFKKQQHTDAETQLIPTSWPADFPSPAIAEQLCRIFFDKSQYLACLFQPSRFFQQMAYGPSSPGFPSFALLHAIFAMTYAYRPDLIPERKYHPVDPNSISNSDTGMTLVKYHCDQVRHHLINLEGRSGNHLFSLLKASLILQNIQYGMGHILEAWTTNGIGIKLATALYLNRGREDTEVVGHEAKVEYLKTSLLRPSSDWMEEEERRRVVFYAFASDRASATSILWTSSANEADLTTSLPMCTTREFHHQRVDGSMSTGQALNSADLFSNHLNDSFHLLIKACLLIGRIGDFLVRLPPSISVQDVKTPEWFNLNHLVSTFSSTIPMQEAPQDGKIDSVRLVADLLIHTCALQLHEPLARLDENSVQMCRAACTGVVNTLRYLHTSQVDFTAFSPSFGVAVGITGRVLCRLLDLARKSYTSDTFTPGFSQLSEFARTGPHNYAQMAGLGGAPGSEAEKVLQDEIDVIFIILCKSGRIWPMANRQAKAIAGQLGVHVASPELLRYGLFTDRNAGNHIYR